MIILVQIHPILKLSLTEQKIFSNISRNINKYASSSLFPSWNKYWQNNYFILHTSPKPFQIKELPHRKLVSYSLKYVKYTKTLTFEQAGYRSVQFLIYNTFLQYKYQWLEYEDGSTLKWMGRGKTITKIWSSRNREKKFKISWKKKHFYNEPKIFWDFVSNVKSLMQSSIGSDTVGIWNLKVSGIQVVKTCPILEWSWFGMVSKNSQKVQISDNKTSENQTS